MLPPLTPPSVEEQCHSITTIELLEEVDRRLSERIFDENRHDETLSQRLADQAEFHHTFALFHARNAVHNYNRARAYENDRQETADFDKEEGPDGR